MIVYVNVMTGQELTRSRPDKWLDASSGWERVGLEPAEGETGPTGDRGEEMTHGRS